MTKPVMRQGKLLNILTEIALNTDRSRNLIGRLIPIHLVIEL